MRVFTLISSLVDILQNVYIAGPTKIDTWHQSSKQRGNMAMAIFVSCPIDHKVIGRLKCFQTS